MRGGVFGAPPAVEYLKSTDKGAAGGVAPLDANKKLPVGNLPDLTAATIGLTAITDLDAATVQKALEEIWPAITALQKAGVAEHSHKTDDVTEGTFGVARGGTGLSTLTKDSFLVGNGTSTITLLTAAEVLAKIGAAASGHNQDASTITAGTFAGEVVANSSGQTPGTSLLRNSKLVSADTNPTVNGEINWTYG